ncbi:hypothetical protein ACJJTC_014849 [Scirpophaga incertulas]
MECKVHRVRCYNPKPESINCVSYNKIKKQLAVARADASIEIWDLNFAPFLLKFITGVKNGSVEALGWVGNRLLSTGLGGALIEWDLEKLNIKTTVLLTGYAAWCLDVNSSNSVVAVGTEQGYINLYNVENGDIVYNKIFDKQEGRIICCKFDKTGTTLVTGSVNTIRVWNVETGHATCRILASRRGKETVVWSLAVLSDSVVVSGDSLGRLTFWDGSLGEQIESYTIQKADILSIVVSEDEKSLYCSGVDPVIVNFIKVNDKSPEESQHQWVKNVQRHIHEHDVRGLVLNGDRLVSVGADGYITLSSYPPKWVMRVPPIIPAPRSSVCPRGKLLMLRYSKHLEVWKLGSYVTDKSGNVVLSKSSTQQNFDTSKNAIIEQDTAITMMDQEISTEYSNERNKNLKLLEKPVKLVSVQTKCNKQIKYCALSPCGKFIVYSTDSALRMLKLETDDDQLNTSLSKLSVSEVSTCDRLVFSADSQTMVVHNDGSLIVMHVDPQAGAVPTQTIPSTMFLKSTSLLHLLISNKITDGGVYLIAVDTEGFIGIWCKTVKKFKPYISLPSYNCVPSAMTIDYERQSLVIVYVDQSVLEYDLLKKKFLQGLSRCLPPQWYARESAVLSVTRHAACDALVFQDLTSLCILNRKTEQENLQKPELKKNFGLNIVPIKYLADFHWIGNDEAVTVELLPEHIVSQLPPVLSVK